MKEPPSPNATESQLNELIALSRRYGVKPDFVLGGGGNTSWKSGNLMYVKNSGSSLKNASSELFTAMDMNRLAKMWDMSWPKDHEERESAVLKFIMEARMPDQGNKRPSVEVLLHALLPCTYVVHTHPTLVNGVTCSREGERIMQQLFGKRSLWIPVVEPGFILAKHVREEIGKRGEIPTIIFLQNHGVFVGADTIQGIDKLYDEIISLIKLKIKRIPATFKPVEWSDECEILQSCLPEYAILPFVSDDLIRYAENPTALDPLKQAFTPDHIVYFGSKTLYLKELAETEQAINKYMKDNNNVVPGIIILKGIGAFSCNPNLKRAELAKQLFMDQVKIAVYAESFGGHIHLPNWFVDFIRNWEVEKFRSQSALS